MKKLFLTTLLLAFVILLTAQTPCWDGTVAESYAGGNGTISDPFQIATAEQLALLAQQTNSGLVGIYHYVLTNDICLSGSDGLTWNPIGYNQNFGSAKAFIGTFDGNGHTVSDMYVTSSPSDTGGLFGCTDSATIKNLNISNSIVNDVRWAGMIVGYAENTNFINCNVGGTISYDSNDYYKLGGIVGYMVIYHALIDTILIKDCINNTNIQAYTTPSKDGDTGGIVGYLIVAQGDNSLILEDCINNGNITAKGDVAGIVGEFGAYLNDGFAINCENYGQIHSLTFAGGIVGRADGCFVENCVNHSSGEVTGARIGGIVSHVEYELKGHILKCVNHAPITGVFSGGGPYWAGGIAGGGCNISNCYNTGDITYSYDGTTNSYINVGGIVGSTNDDGCQNVYNVGQVAYSSEPRTYCGIIIGYIANAQCRNLYWLGDYDIPVCGRDSLVPEGSCAFRPGVTPTTWVLDEPVYGTTDLVDALNYGSNHECTWLEDVDFTNNGLPVFIDYVETFPLIGTEWYYEITNENGSVTYQYLECAADTTIGTTRPKVIVKSNTLYDKDLHTKITHEYVYSEDGIVYWWDKQSQSYTTLYDFNANVGDQWTINVGTHSITMHVDEVNNVEYNGATYRVLTVRDADDIFSGDIICGIGHTTSFFPEKMLNNRDFDVDGMRCYWHFGEELLQFGEVDCDEIYNIYNDVAENEETGFEVYPNPTKDILIIKSDVLEMCHGASLQEYTITNITGQIMMRGTISSDNQQVDISNLENGMYFIKVGEKSMKFIKM